MRFASLGSGSRGNGTIVEEGSTLLLIDCGFSLRETERRLCRLGLAAEQLTAVLVTHEHTDHLGGVATLARRHRIPVWMSVGTRMALALDEVEVREFGSHEPFAVEALEVRPFPVPHDAREPCQFVFSNGARRLGLLTDAGRGTPHLEAQLSGCDALLIETNHDQRMLMEGSYPPSLKLRVGGALGHLSNDQAAGLLGRLDAGRLQHLVAAHLSEQNNQPELARGALAAVLGCNAAWITVAEQAGGFDWREIA